MENDRDTNLPDPLEEAKTVSALNQQTEAVCAKIAARFGLFNAKGEPRKAAILEMLSETDCLPCIVKAMSTKHHDKVDPLYSECHSLAVNILTEEILRVIDNSDEVLATTTEEQLDL